jgi:hypothetical protein
VGESLGLLPFVGEVGQGGVDVFDFAEPVFGFGAGTPGEQVGLDEFEAGSMSGCTCSIGQRRQASLNSTTVDVSAKSACGDLVVLVC